MSQSAPNFCHDFPPWQYFHTEDCNSKQIFKCIFESNVQNHSVTFTICCYRPKRKFRKLSTATKKVTALRKFTLSVNTNSRVGQRAAVYIILNLCISPLFKAVCSPITTAHPLFMLSEGINTLMLVHQHDYLC